MTKIVLDKKEYKTLYDSVKFGKYYIYSTLIALFTLLLIRNNMLNPLYSDIRLGIVDSTTILLLRDRYTIYILVFIFFAETVFYTLYRYSIGSSIISKEPILKITKTYAKTLLIVLPIISLFITAGYDEALTIYYKRVVNNPYTTASYYVGKAIMLTTYIDITLYLLGISTLLLYLKTTQKIHDKTKISPRLIDGPRIGYIALITHVLFSLTSIDFILGASIALTLTSMYLIHKGLSELGEELQCYIIEDDKLIISF